MTIQEPITTITVLGETFNVYTLQTYTTPYYFVPKFGRQNHYRTLAQLSRFVGRAIRKGAR